MQVQPIIDQQKVDVPSGLIGHRKHDRMGETAIDLVRCQEEISGPDPFDYTSGR